MKRTTLAMMTVLAATLAGCVVTSVNPFYTEQDLVFEPALLGQWMATNAESGLVTNAVIEFKRDGDKGYLNITVSESDDKKAETNQTVLRLFKLGDQLFFDSLPMNPHGPEFIPAHRVFKVMSLKPSLQAREMSYDWLKKLIEADPATLPHTQITERNQDGSESCRIVLTAATHELQAFLRKHAATEGAWEDLSEFVFVRSPAQTGGSDASETTGGGDARQPSPSK